MDNNNNPIELMSFVEFFLPVPAESMTFENKQGIYKIIFKTREKKASFFELEELSGNLTLIVL
jgi:hypothetical protein